MLWILIKILESLYKIFRSVDIDLIWSKQKLVAHLRGLEAPKWTNRNHRNSSTNFRIFGPQKMFQLQAAKNTNVPLIGA